MTNIFNESSSSICSFSFSPSISLSHPVDSSHQHQYQKNQKREQFSPFAENESTLYPSPQESPFDQKKQSNLERERSSENDDTKNHLTPVKFRYIFGEDDPFCTKSTHSTFLPWSYHSSDQRAPCSSSLSSFGTGSSELDDIFLFSKPTSNPSYDYSHHHCQCYHQRLTQTGNFQGSHQIKSHGLLANQNPFMETFDHSLESFPFQKETNLLRKRSLIQRNNELLSESDESKRFYEGCSSLSPNNWGECLKAFGIIECNANNKDLKSCQCRNISSTSSLHWRRENIESLASTILSDLKSDKYDSEDDPYDRMVIKRPRSQSPESLLCQWIDIKALAGS